MNSLIFGKNPAERIVSCEPNNGHMELFIQNLDGSIKSEFVQNKFWLLSDENHGGFARLKGDQHYKWGKQFSTKYSYNSCKAKLRNKDIYKVTDLREQFLINKGYTYHKGLTYKEVSILSFDIETTGIKHNKDSKLLCIANTFRDSKGKIYRKLFAYDEYEDEGKMIEHWVNWVKKLNPTILAGHNILSFDFPYLRFIAEKFNVRLDLGRDGSRLEFYPYESSIRIDGNRAQNYTNIRCYGREIFDTYFASIKWDIKKEMESYALKPLISQLGLEVPGRVHYDASQIAKNYLIVSEWEKIKAYATFDGDDPISLYDKIGSTFFYSTQNIPKTFQQVSLSASGAQINTMLIRSYLQDGYSIPKASNLDYVQGGISFGIPGIYNNVLKIDLKSAYPSQIIRFKIFDPIKDPKGHFYLITKYFTEKRLELKEALLKSNDLYLVAQDDTAKVFINSMYGALNTQGLNFNNSILAEKITFETRLLIENAILWASSKNISEWWVKDEKEETEQEAS